MPKLTVNLDNLTIGVMEDLTTRRNFPKLVDALAEMIEIEGVKPEDVRQEIRKMKYAQTGVLVNLILDSIANGGNPKDESGKN
jgi:hypothetical protein